MRLSAIGLASAFAFAPIVAASAQEPVKGARHPALSPDAQWIAFSWRGDIWKVAVAGGRAERLTVHPGDDRSPQFSPDGRWIAFSAKREGNYDVYIIPAAGGAPRQLTFHAAPDQVAGWSPDGRSVLFVTSRDNDRANLYAIPIAGGTERKLTRGATANATFSPDRRTLVINSGSSGGWWRKGYRGDGNWDLLVRPADQVGTATALTTFEGRNGWPYFSADGKSIYFMSDSTGTSQIWRMNADGSGKQAVTRFPRDGAQFLSVAKTGTMAALEFDAGIWTAALGTGSAQPQEVKITAASDEQYNRISRQTFTDQASGMELSPDGREVAFVVRGDVFVVSARGGTTENLTSSPAREFQVAWSPDGKALAFVSDKTGNDEIYVMRSADSAEPRLSRALKTTVTQVTNDPLNDGSPSWSPDGKLIGWRRQADPPSLWVMDPDGKNPRRLIAGYAQAMSWSPDSKWIAFGKQMQSDAGRAGTDLFVIPAAGGEATNITNYPTQNRSPVWSRDGRRLAFVSSRGGDPEPNASRLYQIWLRRVDDEKTADDWRMEEDAGGQADRRTGGQRAAEAASPPPEVVIDLEGIQDRTRLVNNDYAVQSFAFTPDGRQFVFTSSVAGTADVFVMGRDGQNPTRLTRGLGGGGGGGRGGGGGGGAGSLQIDPSGRVYYLSGRGTISNIETSGQNAGSVAFSARVTIDRPAESVQMFEEAWRSLGESFYDPKMHGRDWKAIRSYYLPLAQAAYTKEALGDVVLMMIGELNASHLNFSVPADAEGVRTGELGLLFDDAYRGKGLKVRAVVKGGPTDRVNATVKPGEYLLAVDDQPIADSVNVYQLLANTVGERLRITVATSPEGVGSRTLVVRPIASLGDLQYDDWVATNHEKVRQLSGGRVGYLHIRSMNQPSLEQFKRDLWGREAGTEALIIDQRYNGGGNIHEQLWTELLRRAPIYFTNRAGERRPSPAQWTRPTVVLQNQNSFSDAEIFPMGFKALKLGKTIGVRTGGGVIGTRNINLIDGSTFRLPGSGVFGMSDGKNLENWGIEPDLYVVNPFEHEALGRDAQLEAAVKELLAQLGGTVRATGGRN